MELSFEMGTAVAFGIDTGPDTRRQQIGNSWAVKLEKWWSIAGEPNHHSSHRNGPIRRCGGQRWAQTIRMVNTP